MAILAQDFDIISAIVRERSAIVLERGKEYLVESRLAPVAHAHGLRDLHQLAQAMTLSPNGLLTVDVIDAMTTNETSFFRDVRPFEALQTTILPALIKARSAQRSLTIWCAACSTGQEPYSVAMTIAEHFPELASWQVRIIGTDLSATALKQAARGAYSQLQVNRGVPAPLLVKHFERKGMEFQLRSDVMRRVEFRPGNLIGTWSAMPTLDLVLVRNVLIYFDNAAREQILRRVHGVLAHDGYLVLGSTESMIGLNVPFRREAAGAISVLRPNGPATPSGTCGTSSAAPPTAIPAIHAPAGAYLASRSAGTGKTPAFTARPITKDLRS